jgi:hypothetical protein
MEKSFAKKTSDREKTKSPKENLGRSTSQDVAHELKVLD